MTLGVLIFTIVRLFTVEDAFWNVSPVWVVASSSCIEIQYQCGLHAHICLQKAPKLLHCPVCVARCTMLLLCYSAAVITCWKKKAFILLTSGPLVKFSSVAVLAVFNL